MKATNGAATFTDYRYGYTSGSTDRDVVGTRTDTAGLVTSYGYDAGNELLSAVGGG